MAPNTPRKGPSTPKKAPPASPQTPTRMSRRLAGQNPELNISNPLTSPTKSAKKRSARQTKKSPNKAEDKVPKKITKKVLDFLSPSKHDSEFNDSGEEQKVHNVSRGSKSTPQQKSVTPKSTTPQQKTVTPKVITPKQKSVTPKSATPQQKTVTPKDKPFKGSPLKRKLEESSDDDQSDDGQPQFAKKTPPSSGKKQSPKQQLVGQKKSPKVKPSPHQSKATPAEDNFFSVNEMEAFLDEQDQLGNQSMSLFAQFDDDVGDADYHYADFFGGSDSNQNEEESDEDHIEGIDDNMLPFGEPESWDSELDEMEEQESDDETPAKKLLNMEAESGEDELTDEDMGDEEGLSDEELDLNNEDEHADFGELEEEEESETELANGSTRPKQYDFTLSDEEESGEEEVEEDEEELPSKKSKKRVSFTGLSDEEENELDEEKMEKNEPETHFGKQRKQMEYTIAEYERQNLEPRSWELSGEVTAHEREQDSLLKQYIEVDYKATQAPVINEDVNARIEAIVKRRIKDKNFDDVIRTKRVDESLQTYRARTTLDDIERKSLMQMYEDEYRRKSESTKENLNGNKMDVDEQEEKLDPESEAIEREMNGIFSKLDALCHSHYRPSEQQVEPEVIVNKLAVNLEEVGQRGVTAPDEELLAPEEIVKHAKFVPKSKEERDKTDKLRERRKKKKKQKVIVRAKARKGFNNAAPSKSNREKREDATKKSSFNKRHKHTVKSET